MRSLPVIFLVASFQFPSSAIATDAPDDANEILARRGNGVVTQDAFYARAERIPAGSRFAALRDRNRVRDLITALLLNSQLAADARATGFDKDPIVIDRMQLAAEAELATAWVQQYIAMQGEPDYEALAYENYLLNKDQMRSQETVDVTHILVATEERSEEAAKTLADSIYRQIMADPTLFDKMVIEYSEDPSAVSNHGKFKAVTRGDLVKPFEEVAFSLKGGEISPPVKTQFGYHIIRLDAHNAPQQLSFEDAKARLIKQEESKHGERIRRDYLSSLTSFDVMLTEEGLREMVRRRFGEDVLVQKAEPEKTE